MQSHQQPTQPSWFQSILKNITLRHKIELNLYEDRQISSLYQIVGQLSATPTDYLEILRLFDAALSQKMKLIIGERLLTTLDIFHASVIVGLKTVNETQPNRMTVTEIMRHLPITSPYFQDFKKLAPIEKAFLSGMDWKVHGAQDETLKAYETLLDGLPLEALGDLVVSTLLTAGLGAGEYHSLLEIYAKRLNDTFIENALTVVSALRELPLSQFFTHNSQALRLIRADIRAFIDHPETPFSIGSSTMHCIRTAIFDYVKMSSKLIHDGQILSLGRYFDANNINRIIGLSCMTVLRNLHPHETWFLSAPYRLLEDAIVEDKTDLRWLLPLLNDLESLKKERALKLGILFDIFTDLNDSAVILKHYMNLHREGWLRVINANDDLFRQVSSLIVKFRHVPFLMPFIADAMVVYFTINFPKKNQLAYLRKWGRIGLGKSVADRISYIVYSHCVDMIATKLADSSYNVTMLSTLDEYYRANEKEQMKLVVQLEIIKNVICDENKTLAIMLLSVPHMLVFSTELVINLMQIIDSLNLKYMIYQIPLFYHRILENIRFDESLKRVMEAMPIDVRVKTRDEVPIYQSIKLFKEMIRSVIESGIANQSPAEMEDYIDNLNRFYRAYKMEPSAVQKSISSEMHPSAALKSSSSSHGLFSPQFVCSDSEDRDLIPASPTAHA